MKNRLITKCSDIVGQSFPKNILYSKIVNNKDPQVIIFTGPSGCGKSTTASWYALSRACEKPQLDPCCKCPTCQANIEGLMQASGQGFNVKRFNLALYTKLDDAKELIKKVFNFQNLSSGNIFYIFEELQKFPEFQTLVLPELDHVPENVHLFFTTSNESCLDKQFIGRADLLLRFKALLDVEAKTLIDSICKTNNFEKLSEQDKNFLINVTHNDARAITNALENLGDMNNLPAVLREYYNAIDTSYYLSFLNSCFKDFDSFLFDLAELEKKVDILQFWRGMSSFIRHSIFLVGVGERYTLLSKKDCERVVEIFKQLSNEQKRKLWKASQRVAKTKEYADYCCTLMQELVNEKEVSSKTELVEEVNKAEKNREIEKIEEMKKDTLVNKPKKMSIADMANILGSDEVLTLSSQK